MSAADYEHHHKARAWEAAHVVERQQQKFGTRPMYRVDLDESNGSVSLWLTGRSVNLLAYRGITTVAELCEKTATELLKEPNVGNATVANVREALRQNDLSLKGDLPTEESRKSWETAWPVPKTRAVVAFFLRCRGLSFKSIAKLVGAEDDPRRPISVVRVRQLCMKAAERLAHRPDHELFDMARAYLGAPQFPGEAFDDR